MKAESAEGAFTAPAKRLREELWERASRLIVPRLGRFLRFAKPEEVLQLVRRQYHHTWSEPEGLASLLRERRDEGQDPEAWIDEKAQGRCDRVVRVDTAPTTFSADACPDLRLFVLRLTPAADAVSTYLRDRFALSLERVLDHSPAEGAARERLSRLLIEKLNQTVDGPRLDEEARFAGVALRPETQRLLVRASPGARCPRLNRLLLEDAYPSELPREELVAVAYVKDCDLVAEYLEPTTGAERREEIRGAYWHAYRGWIAETLLRLFRERSGSISSDDPRLEEAQAWVEDRVFSESPFRETLAKYRPELGKTLAGFLEDPPLIGRCYDARDRVAAKPGTVLFEEDHGAMIHSEAATSGATAPATEPGDGEPEAESAADRLQRRLTVLRDHARAAMELRYRAYVNPQKMAAWTLERVARQTCGAQLLEEYEADRQGLWTLQEEEIPRRETERQEVYARREACRVELEVRGWSRRQINDLASGRDRTIADLEGERSRSSTAASRRLEIEFQIACVRYRKALSRLLDARDQLARYRQAQHPWVRSQEAVAKLLGVDQVTISHWLNEGLRGGATVP